jgi:hypothetical protein
MDYYSLIAAVKDYSKRKNISDSTISTFIESALSRANWALRIPSIEDYALLTISSTGYIQIPSNFLEVKELSINVDGKKLILDRKSNSEVDSLSNFNGEGTGYPELFSRFGNYFQIAPWGLGEDYLASLYYYAALEPLAEGNTTNWFTTSAPTVLLYGALEELCNYTRDTEGAAQWANKFTQEVNILQAVEDKAAWSGSTLAISPQGSIIGRGQR